MKKICVTFDIDWAPEWAIELCLELCAKCEVPATVFVTHNSPSIKSAMNSSAPHEFGIHPNFHPGSSHGKNIEAILDYCLEMVPGAISYRTHGLYQSSNHLFMAAQRGLINDVSTLLPLHQNLYPSPLPYSTPENLRTLKIPYFWEDDVMHRFADWNWDKQIDGGDIEIYDFHPIHVALNSINDDAYCELKNRLDGQALDKLSYDKVKDLINTSTSGTRTYLEKLLSEKRGEYMTIAQLGAGY